MSTNMAKGTPVRNHVLKMMSHQNKLEILGAEIEKETQVDIVLYSLLESFTQFFLNCNMNKHSYSLAELLKKLQSAEGLIKPVICAYVAEKILLLR